MRQWGLPDVRFQRLFQSSGEYRTLAAALNEALGFLWQLELDGLTAASSPHPPRLIPSPEGYFFVYDKIYVDLLKPPGPDETRFDQVLRWAEQQSGVMLQRCTEAVRQMDTRRDNPVCAGTSR